MARNRPDESERWTGRARAALAAPALLLPVLVWHASLARELASGSLGVRAGAAADGAAWAGAIAALLSALAEAAVYGMLWAAFGRRLPFLALAVTALQLSMLEPAALWAGALGGDPGDAPLWKVMLFGTRASGAAVTGFAAAFRSLGALALARMAFWAWVLAAASGARWRSSATAVAVVWLVSHLALGFVLALMWGRSTT
ncbi:MAG TPA: hypothetical protein VMH61_01700 [Candidatus Acidoferrales bacterium]|nr:hypothetical protein [Candidatus Acidoferrales bacterium]